MSDLRAAAQMALEALEDAPYMSNKDDYARLGKTITALRAALDSPEPDGLPLVVAGAIYDFAGYLTTRPITIEVGSAANASPMADLVKDWAKLRGLSLDDAAVLSWQEWLHTAPPQRRPLTDEAIDRIIASNVTITDQNLRGAVYMAMRELEEEYLK